MEKSKHGFCEPLDIIPTGGYGETVSQEINPANDRRHESKTRILDAALRVIRAKGYSATRIEDVCEEAGLTKGSFFHHFKTKEELAVAAADYWSETTSAFFAASAYRSIEDPLQALLAYIDLRKDLIRGGLPDFSCLVGTMVQETFATHPIIRDACGRSINGHAATLVPMIEAARRQYGVEGAWTAESLAQYTQAAIQGAFVLAKAENDLSRAADTLDHLRRYVELLFRSGSGQPAAGQPVLREIL